LISDEMLSVLLGNRLVLLRLLLLRSQLRNLVNHATVQSLAASNCMQFICCCLFCLL